MKNELSVVFESKLVLRFTLPGTRTRSYSGHGGTTQLEQRGEHHESYELHTTQENALETARVLHALASEIERVARSVK